MPAEYDPVTSLRHYPTPLKRFGTNVYGENLYRIVLAKSRCHLIGGFWPDTGETAYHWRETYPHIKGWVLERWQSCRISKFEWDQLVEPISGWLINGPYPARGEYYLAWGFNKGVDADSLDKIIGAIERGRNYSVADIDQVNRAEYEAEEKANRTNAYDDIRDGFSAYGSRPFASSRVARGTKTAPRQRTAQELGLPIPKAMPQAPLKVTSRRTVDVRDIKVRNTLTAVPSQGETHA